MLPIALFQDNDLPTCLTQRDIEEIEHATKGQRANAKWSLARRGRLTASNFGPVLKSVASGRKPSASLMKSLLESNNLAGVTAVQWGITHERDALAMYEDHCKVSVRPSGIWLHSSGVLGASPDGLVGEHEIVEVKCPYSARDGLFAKIDEGSFYIKRDTTADCVGGDSLYLDASSGLGLVYYHQIQGNLYLTGREVCRLIVWAPNEMLVMNVKKDPAWAHNLQVLLEFFDRYMRPVPKVASTQYGGGDEPSGGKSGLLCVLR